MKVDVTLTDDQGRIIEGPYIVRFPGWTEERYYREGPTDRKSEYVHGDVIIMTPMSSDHSKITLFLGSLLHQFCEARELGPALAGPTLRLEPGLNREPDLCFYTKERAHLAEGMPIEAVPDFIIEVSHTTRGMDLGEKCYNYEASGVSEYWVVDLTEEEVVVHTLEGDRYQKEGHKEGKLFSRQVDGFWIDVGWLWKKPLPSAFECLRELVGF